jgi:hypothetical protein
VNPSLRTSFGIAIPMLKRGNGKPGGINATHCTSTENCCPTVTAPAGVVAIAMDWAWS